MAGPRAEPGAPGRRGGGRAAKPRARAHFRPAVSLVIAALALRAG
ncbi:hypothetical protein HNR76_002118 [Pseudoxanthomonas broegbernensis]|nr:hypothetical protein [Pseudoxanthomonas broegbernensis]